MDLIHENSKMGVFFSQGKSLAFRLGNGIIGTLIFIVIWFGMGYILFHRPQYEMFSGFLPVPTAKALLGLILEGDFWYSVWASLRRVVIGISMAFLMGLPSGLLIGYYRKLQELTYPPIQFLRMISPLSWMPIALLVFAQFESAIYFLITMATIWPIILNTMLGVSRVNPHWIDMARNQGASDYQLMTRIIIPASVPHILVSLRMALGVAWIVLVPAEFFGVTSGLGYMINDARDTLEYDRLMAILIAIGILGCIFDGSLKAVQKMLNPVWRS